MINGSSAVERCSPWMHAAIVRYRDDDHKVGKLQDESDQDGTYKYTNKEAHKCYPSHGRRLPTKSGIKEQQVKKQKNNVLVAHFTELYMHKQSRKKLKETEVAC